MNEPQVPRIPQNMDEVMKHTVEEFLRLPQDLHAVAAQFASQNIENSIVFFGSARLLPEKTILKQIKQLEQTSPKEDPLIEEKLQHAKDCLCMSQYYNAAEELSFKLTEWTLKHPDHKKHFLICSGGGPGIMEASNKGAHRANGRSIGLSIIIPREQKSNAFITPELDFTFDTFILRKFWFFYFMKAVVVFPGGVGTLDEFFEILTLITTGKLPYKVPLVLFGSDYWKNVINFDTLVKHGTVTRQEINFLTYSDSVEETFNFITHQLTQLYL